MIKRNLPRYLEDYSKLTMMSVWLYFFHIYLQKYYSLYEILDILLRTNKHIWNDVTTSTCALIKHERFYTIRYHICKLCKHTSTNIIK